MPDRPSRLARAVAVLGLLAVVVGALPARAAEDDGPPTPLEAVVARLGEEARAFDSGAQWGISVLNLDTGEAAQFQGDQWFKAASVLKPTWMAAALREAGIEAVEPHAELVMVWSNNDFAGRVLSIAGGIDAANSLTLGLGMNDTLVVEWTFGIRQRSKYYPGAHPYLNYTTANDLVTFWRWLYEGAVLPPAETEALLEWGRLPKSGTHATLVARLPEEVVEHVSYKVGALPPGRTYENDEGEDEPPPEGSTDAMIGAGVVEVPGGPTYVVAIAATKGWSWFGKLSFVEYASCRIYEVLADDPQECDRSGDPSRTRLDTDEPTGGLSLVKGDAEFVDVRGWASDPDDPFGTIRVRFTVDGHWSGITRADHRHSWGADPSVVWDGHGFETTLLALLAPGEHEICAHAINDGAGPDTEIGCMTHVVG